MQTPSLQGEFHKVRDPDADPPALVCTVGSTELRYHLRAVEDLHTMLVERGDWARDPDNPVGGWYGLKKGLRGRFGNYLPPVLEVMGLAEVEHNARNNRMRAL